mgnify:CR=1 FL=1
MKDKYWEGFADGMEFANRLWSDTDIDDSTLGSILEEHIDRIRDRIK